MKTDNEMLSRIRAALKRDGSITPSALLPFADSHQSRDPEELKLRLTTELERVSSRVTTIRSEAELQHYIEGVLTSDRKWCVAVSDFRDNELVRSTLNSRGHSVVPSLREFNRVRASQVISPQEAYKVALVEADVGITSAKFGLADTGTLVLMTGDEQQRMISLVPPVHICLLKAKNILTGLGALFKLIGASPPQAMTFITGPSRTADIELSLTLGVHGPRELHVLLMEE
jgi:L-lactate utilization protein LutC